MARRFTLRSPLPVPPASLWAWHARPGAFARLAPPWQRVEPLGEPAAPAEGARTTLRLKTGPVWRRWVARHEDVRPGAGFTDVQERGPFATWRHVHRFLPRPGGSHLEDDITFALPGGALGTWLGAGFVRRALTRVFRWRHATTAADLARHGTTALGPQRILVSGAGGLVGSQLLPFLRTGGHEVIRLVRREAGPGERRWDPSSASLDPALFADVDAVIHLGGVGIADKRWSAARKEAIRESRTGSTRRLAEAIAQASPRPRTLLVASAVGIHGSRGDEVLDEQSTPGADFLAGVCQAWEAAADPARAAGVRTAHLRFGVILDPRGGALGRMLPPFRMGAGGRLGSGTQWMAWVALDDVLGAILHVLGTPSLAGPVVVAAPEPVRQRDFARALGRVLGRPAFLPMPAFVARMAFGEVADALLLASQRPHPSALLRSGFRFHHPTLDGALRHMLGRAPQAAPAPSTQRTSTPTESPSCATTSS
jgi:uncharacterized protein (TIGR01777 family)